MAFGGSGGGRREGLLGEIRVRFEVRGTILNTPACSVRLDVCDQKVDIMSDTMVLSEAQIREDFAYLVRLAVALTGRSQDADDLAQSAFLKGLTGMPAGVASRRGYMRRILVNLNIDALRRRGVVLEVPTDEAHLPVPATDPFPAADVRVDVDAALRELPLLTRQVLVLRYLEDLSVEQIPKLLDRPEGTVRRVSAQGLRRMTGLLPAPEGKGGSNV